MLRGKTHCASLLDVLVPLVLEDCEHHCLDDGKGAEAESVVLHAQTRIQTQGPGITSGSFLCNWITSLYSGLLWGISEVV